MTTTEDAQLSTTAHSAQRTAHSRLRLVPPIAALTTAACLQIIAVADVLGTALGDKLGNRTAGYLAGAAFGIAVAASIEGGAAYLLDLLDKHTLAGDSTWALRLALLAYVGTSAAALHAWMVQVHIPVVTSWVLAFMTLSSIYLWSRGSRWQHRERMRELGQIDTALPRLSMGARLLHPLRWAITMWLVTWDPATTTSEARNRYAQWRDGRRRPVRAQVATVGALETGTAQALTGRPARSGRHAAVTTQAHTEPTGAVCGEVVDQDPDDDGSAQVLTERRTVTVTAVTRQVSTRRTVPVQELAQALSAKYGREIPGLPTAGPYLRTTFGSCSDGRVRDAIRIARGDAS